MTKIKFLSPFFCLITLCLLRILFMLKANLLVEEAYYWNYSTHLDFSFLDHPPMVALLIKFGTFIFGTSEWGVRFATIPCWIFTVYFSFKLTNLIKEGAGIYAVFFLAGLPFFFIHSLIITPDIPLILCWSAALYYLYQSLILDKSQGWYFVGIWLGLGLLSKYTIALLGLATFVFLIIEPTARKWLRRKEPYLSAFIAFILFSPVIYWNATHGWASFLFQSVDRFQSEYRFSFHELIGLFIVFLTPAGLLSSWMLISSKAAAIKQSIPLTVQSFLKIYAFVPLFFFIYYSLFHGIKINWIGPSLLALIPWLATIIATKQKIMGFSSSKSWLVSLIGLSICYVALIYCILTANPRSIHQVLFEKMLPWVSFSNQLNQLAQQLEQHYHDAPIVIPMDSYNIGSEFNFYQQKLYERQQINSIYKVIGSHVFGLNSLMFNYWGTKEELQGKYLILVSQKPYAFDYPLITQYTQPLSPNLKLLFQGENKTTPFYYKVVKFIS